MGSYLNQIKTTQYKEETTKCLYLFMANKNCLHLYNTNRIVYIVPHSVCVCPGACGNLMLILCYVYLTQSWHFSNE